jgi:hypothetical protein
LFAGSQAWQPDGRIILIFTDPRTDQGGIVAPIVWWHADSGSRNGCELPPANREPLRRA